MSDSRSQAFRKMGSLQEDWVDWLAFASKIANLDTLLMEARVLLEEDSHEPAGFKHFGAGSSLQSTPPMSSSERKKRTNKVLKSLQSAQHQLQPIAGKLERLAEVLETREEIVTKLDDLTQDMHLLSDKHQQTKDENEMLKHEQATLEKQVRTAASELQKLQAILTEGAEKYKQAIAAAREADELYRDNLRLSAQAKESAEACMLSEERAQRALQSSEAHQQSIAKLTADGVIQALQHKQCEANLASVTSERDVLQAEVSQSRGPLYEEVRKDVEARISETMRQLHDKDMQIEQLRHEHRQEDLNKDGDLKLLRTDFNKLQSRLTVAERELQDAHQGEARLQERLKTSDKSLEEAEQVCKLQQTELEALRADFQATQNKLESTQAEQIAREQAAEEFASQKAAWRKERNTFQESLKKSAVMLEKEKLVNRQLMQRKQDVEWQLMEMMSQTSCELPGLGCTIVPTDIPLDGTILSILDQPLSADCV